MAKEARRSKAETRNPRAIAKFQNRRKKAQKAQNEWTDSSLPRNLLWTRLSARRLSFISIGQICTPLRHLQTPHTGVWFPQPSASFVLKKERVPGLLRPNRAALRHYAEPAVPVL